MKKGGVGGRNKKKQQGKKKGICLVKIIRALTRGRISKRGDIKKN